MVTIDSYDIANRDTYTSLLVVHPSAVAVESGSGQCFTVLQFCQITSVQFAFQKSGAPVGNLVAVIYALTDIYGNSGKPTGAAIATSNAVAMEGLNIAWQMETFTFPTPVNMRPGQYCIAVQVLNATTLDASNKPRWGFDVSAPSHGGNAFTYHDSAWFSSLASDAAFTVTGNLVSIKSGAIAKVIVGVF